MFGRGGAFSGFPFANDPFFRDPFAQMDQMMSSMFNDPFFASAGFGGFPQARGPHPPQIRFQDVGASAPPPVIVELDDDHHALPSSSHEPIVEEPEDDAEEVQHRAQRPRRHSPRRVPVTGPSRPQATGPPGVSYMYSSSSFNSLGPGGVTYQSNTTTTMGPGGVRKTQAYVRDGCNGTEHVTVARGLGDQELVMVRERDASGREQRREHTNGIARGQEDHFEREWLQHAEQHLPRGGGLLGRSQSGPQQQRQQQYALPSSMGAGSSGTGGQSETAERSGRLPTYGSSDGGSRYGSAYSRNGNGNRASGRYV